MSALSGRATAAVPQSGRARACWVLVVAALLAAAVLAVPPTAAAATGHLVISQVYGGGNSTGATYHDDYIELFNPTLSTVTLASNWSVQYASAAGTTWSVTVLPSGINIAAGHYLLVQEAAGTTGIALPNPDVAGGTISMAAAAGKVALVNGTTALTGTCPVGLVDFVGYGGTATCFEGSGPTAAPSATTAALRNNGGNADSDDNAADFAVGAPTPRNSSTGYSDAAPTVVTTSPTSNAKGVAVDGTVSVTFSEPVDLSGDWLGLSCASSGVHTGTTSGGPYTYVFDPTNDLTGGETCSVTVVAADVADQDAFDPPDTMAADYQFNFTVLIRIHDIQGAAHISPVAGMTVTTQGIVTARRSNGFYLQDDSPDADPATSEGIFVFTSSLPSAFVGDLVRVTGTVSEFRSGGASSTNLTVTEIAAPTVAVFSTGNALPDPVVIGAGGRVPPGAVIEDDATSSVETDGVFDPNADGIDFYESLEGMRVQVNDAVAVGPTQTLNTTHEVAVVGDNGATATTRTGRGGIVVTASDFNPERVILDDAIGAATLPTVNVGDGFPGATYGVVDYAAGTYTVEVTTVPSAVTGGLAREVTSLAGSASQLSVATYNADNLAATDDQTKFDRLAAQIVTNLAAPDVVAVEEVQDNNGGADDGTVAADLTIGKLITAISAAGGPTYDYRQIDPVNDQDGGTTGGNIRQVFLFRTDRGLAFVDRAGGDSTTATTVVTGDGGPTLSVSPGRVDPTNTAFTASRKPLAAEFTFNSHHVFVVANHFSSKAGDSPLYGRYQPPVLASEAQRTQQATVVHDFVAQILAADPNADVAVVGDLNDYQFSNPVAALEGSTPILTDLIDTLPVTERYGYLFEGNSEVLDHILVSADLSSRGATYDSVHVNAEFADQASDHDPQVALLTLPPPPPSAPAQLADTPTAVPGTGQVELSWTPPADNGSPITGYDIAISPPRTGAVDPELVSIAGDDTTQGTTVVGLTNGVGYTFTVRAKNAVGEAPWSGEATATPTPGDVTSLTWTPHLVAAGTDNHAMLTLSVSWLPPAGATGVRVCLTSGPVAGPPACGSGSSHDVAAATHSTTFSPVGRNVTYTVSAFAYDEHPGYGQGATATAYGSSLSTPAAKPIRYGTSTTLATTLSRSGAGTAVTGQPVQLWAKAVGAAAWSLVKTVTTSSTGAATVSVAPKRNTTYQWRYAGSAAKHQLASTSATALVTVGFALSATGLTRSSVPRGAAVTLYGLVAPKAAGAYVYLQVGTVTKTIRAAIAWQTLPNGRTGYGFRITWKPTSRGTFSVRAYKPASSTLAAGYGPRYRLVVT